MEIEAAAAPLAERPGTRIGPYKLLQQIGAGGMGVVSMAEQDADGACAVDIGAALTRSS